MVDLIGKFGAVWSNSIESVERFNRRASLILFYPLLVWCKKVGLSPLFFVGFRIFSLPILYLLFEESLFWTGVLLVLLVLSDIIDGLLARYLGIMTDRGRFEDLFSDFLLYGVCLLALVNLRAADFDLIAYSLLITPVLTVLAILKKQEHAKTDWLIRPQPHIWYYKVLFFATLFVYLFLAENRLDELFWFTNVFMTIESVYCFAALQKRWGGENHKSVIASAALRQAQGKLRNPIVK